MKQKIFFIQDIGKEKKAKYFFLKSKFFFLVKYKYTRRF